MFQLSHQNYDKNFHFFLQDLESDLQMEFVGNSAEKAIFSVGSDVLLLLAELQT